MGNKLMLWKAIYNDNTVHKEDENVFDDINRDNLKYFMLEGMDTIFKHDVEEGSITVGDNNFIFLLNDKLIGKSSDIINYKEKIKMAIGSSDIEKEIVGYYTGWKEKNEDFDNIEVLFWVDMINGEVKLRLRLTPNNASVINSNFSLIINGMMNNEELKFPNIGKRQEFIFMLFDS